jgi:hypothetical protein
MNEGGDRILRLTAELTQARKERDAWKDLCRYWRRMAHRFADPETIVRALEADAGVEVATDARV